MNHPRSSSHPLSESIRATLERLRSLSQVSVQAGWRYFDGDLPLEQALAPEHWQTWTVSSVNAKDHHPWGKGRVVRWFARTLQVPSDLQGFPLTGLCLRLGLLWWSEDTQVYVNGQLVQSGDLFDCAPRLLLSGAVQPGDEFAIALRLVSPIHDDGALMKSICHYEAPTPDAPLEPSFIANEFAVLHSYLEAFAPDQLELLAHALTQLDWQSLTHPPTVTAAQHPFTTSLLAVRQSLLPLAAPVNQRQISLLGHAHLDMAWLWTVEETWNAADRTFQSVLALQADFPELTFAHTTPALYAWMEAHRPDLFAQICAQVQAGRWEIVAGFWIEPELNLIGGESMVRQVLYGQRYCQEKFGALCPIAWVPDTFGFTWQLPQILHQGGVEWFVTQKLRWNDTTQFPYDLFQWQAPDGSRVRSLMSAPIGEFIDPVKMANFAWGFEQKTGVGHSLWLPGVGDHGGGPTRDMLEVARRWQQSPFFPQLQFGTAQDYLTEIAPETDSLPVWNSELYLEYHRGCYTTHADQKQLNRTTETALYEAELWSALAAIATAQPYPHAELETAWKLTLFNQFHDILPGSSITPVFEQANEDWETATAIAWDATAAAQRSLATQLDLPTPPHPEAKVLVVFNALNWSRTAIVQTDVWVRETDSRSWQVQDMTGTLISQQSVQRLPGGSVVVMAFVAEAIPAIGYRAYWLCPVDEAPTPDPTPNSDIAPTDLVLENAYLRVAIAPHTGDIASLFDKTQQREVLAAPGNQLQAFSDRGQYWDAWNIDPHYAEHPLPAPELVRIATGRDAFPDVVDQALIPFQQRILVERRIGNSVFQQIYRLDADAPLLVIDTQVDWQERHVLVKAAFPLNLTATAATYEIPCGAIQRTTQPQTEAEKAQWEVPALRWADLSDPEAECPNGVSLLNDCKYGYDAQPHQLRLTLLRGAEWPDPESDRGFHAFSYALYPHAGDWRSAQTVRHGYELNLPLSVLSIETGTASGNLPPSGSLLDLGDENLVLMALKQAEDLDEAGNPAWILRCYEAHGEPAHLRLTSDLPLQPVAQVDGLERPLTENAAISRDRGESPFSVRPWQILSLKLTTEPTQ